MTSLQRSLCAVLVLCAVSACQRGPVSWEEPERMNAEPGALGRFTSPYYNAIHPLDGGGALIAFMRTDGRYRTFVVRRAADGRAVFDAERSLTPEDLRESVAMGPAIVDGPSGGELFMVWQARRLVSGAKYVLFRRSRDGGVTWDAPVVLSSETTPFLPDIAADHDGAVYVAWPDERAGALNVFFNRSADAGATWLQSDVGLEPSETRGRRALSVTIASDGNGRVVAAWEDEVKSGRVIYAASSRDKGVTWSPPVRVDDEKTRLSPTAPQAAFIGGRAVLVWVGAATGTSPIGQVWSDVSSDGGLTWGEDILLHETRGGSASRAHLVADATSVHLVFHAGPFTKSSQIYHAVFDESGAWRATGDALTRITTTEGQFSNPRLAIEGGTLYAVYEDAQKRIRLTRSTDGGATWSTDSIVVTEVTDPNSQTRVRYPQIAASDGAVYVTWEEWHDPEGKAEGVGKSLVETDGARRPVDLWVRRARFTR